MCLSSDRLPKTAEDTAEFLLRLNNSVDILNSSTLHSSNHLKSALSTANIADRRRLLEEVSTWLGMWSAQVPSVRGLQQTIAGVLAIWDRFGGDVLSFLMTRRLNQDGLENLFGVIRMSSGQNDVPNPTQFRMALRKCVTTNLLTAPTTANCEPDGDALLCAFASVARRVRRESQTVIHASQCTAPPSLQPLDSIDQNILTYVGGYLLRRGSEKHWCDQCRIALSKAEKVVVYEREMLCGLKYVTGVSDVDVGSLLKPTQAFYDVVELTYSVTQAMAPSLLHQPGVMSGIEPHIMSAREVTDMLGSLCQRSPLQFMVRLFVRLHLHVMYKRRTSASAAAKGGKCRKLVKLACRVDRKQ